MNQIILLSLVLAAALASQYVPIPKKEIGLLMGNKNAQIQIELVYDPICDDSAQFDEWFQSALNSLSSQQRQKISVRFLPFALPFHMASQKLVQAIVHVIETKGHEAAIKLLRSFFKSKQQWYERRVREQSIGELMQRISKKLNQQFSLDIQQTIKQLSAGSKAEKKSRQWSKVIMGSLKAAGTPRFIINKASVDDAVNLTEQKITNIIKFLFIADQNDEN